MCYELNLNHIFDKIHLSLILFKEIIYIPALFCLINLLSKPEYLDQSQHFQKPDNPENLQPFGNLDVRQVCVCTSFKQHIKRNGC